MRGVNTQPRLSPDRCSASPAPAHAGCEQVFPDRLPGPAPTEVPLSRQERLVASGCRWGRRGPVHVSGCSGPGERKNERGLLLPRVCGQPVTTQMERSQLSPRLTVVAPLLCAKNRSRRWGSHGEPAGDGSRFRKLLASTMGAATTEAGVSGMSSAASRPRQAEGARARALRHG